MLYETFGFVSNISIMIRHIINNHLPDGLEYGTIYVFTDLYAPKQLLDDYVLAMQHACQQAHALQRFELQVLYADISPTLVARRFNAGNIGKEALLTCPVCGDISIDQRLVTEFVQQLFDFGRLDTGDSAIAIEQFLNKGEREQMRRHLEHPDLAAKLQKAQQQAQLVQQQDMSPLPEDSALNEAERLRDQYLKIVGQLVTNYVLLTHSDPRELLGDTLEGQSPLVFAPRQLSRLVFDSDLRMWLSDYGNAEIRLHPLSKAIYILFLKHPEGIELRDIDRHADELRQIYDIVMPARDIATSDTIIDNVLNPLTGTLLQNLSRIKRFFKTVIMDDNVASQYYISGHRGQAYGISLPRNRVTMPRVF